MAKRKQPGSSENRGKPSPLVDVRVALKLAEEMLEKERYEEVIRILQPLGGRHSLAFDYHTMLGSAYAGIGELWSSAAEYQKALSIRKDVHLLASLGAVYVDLELRVLALDTFRRAFKTGYKEPLHGGIPRMILRSLEDEISVMASAIKLPLDKAVKGLRLFEEGQVALHTKNYTQSVLLNRKAARLLGDFPPVQNNLSLALFFHGLPEEAKRTARQVVARNPENIQALSNLIRFLSWTGESEKAGRYWEQLKVLSPRDHSNRMKMVEAAAIMEADEDVYRLLIEQEKKPGQQLARREKLYLALAEANTGRGAAKQRLQELQESVDWARQILQVLNAGKRGLGWSERFPYFHVSELLPERDLESLIELLKREGKIPDAKFRREAERFAARFPQLILVGKKILLEEKQVDAALGILTTLATPEAYAVLREFGLGKVGDDEARMQTLLALMNEGVLPENEHVRVWQDGQWRDVELRKYEIIERRDPAYSSQILDILERAHFDFLENRLEKAEKGFRRVIELDPRAKEAYNNLATVYARKEMHQQAREMFQKAIELDPLYVMPRCNLAIYLLGDDKVDDAREMIAPVENLKQFHPQEMAFLSYVQARILLFEDEYDRARSVLKMAMQVYPDYEPAKDLLEHIDLVERLRGGFTSFWEDRRKRDLAKRERQRSTITTPDPTVEEALSIYTKDILTAIAWRIIPWGGWSAYKKSKLFRMIMDYLRDKTSLGRILEALTDEERAAFEFVRSKGGVVAWELFEETFGNDLEDSPYWQYHEPESVMGRLRVHGLLVEALVDGELMLVIPLELRRPGGEE